MTLVVLLAALVAAANTAASLWLGTKAKATGWFWQAQLTAGALRFCSIFGGASGLWAWRRRMPEVVVFILVGAVGQMVGQTYFLLRKRSAA
ncbi:MAG: hypothetical protein HY059_22365 [Proteobacteria bacterium]|nr:hypothetical protein [Pseudomonadota bacterium]